MNPEMEALLAELGITPEDLQAMFEAGVFDERAGMLQDQMGMANQMRNTAAPDMRQVGRVAVAANPLEMLGAGMGRVKGEGQMAGLMDQRSSLIDMLRKGRQAGGLVGMRDRMGPQTGNPADLKPDPYGDDEWSGIPALLRRPQG